MSTTNSCIKRNPRNSPNELEIEKYEIERVPAAYFRYRDFRYTNVEDALAQAKRDETSQAPERLS
jgi:hypothetical protein